MEVTGRVKVVDQTKEVGSGGFRKRDQRFIRRVVQSQIAKHNY